MILSINNWEVDHLEIKSIVKNFIKNGDVKLEHVPSLAYWLTVKVTILLIYYRFIVRFTIGFEFQFIAFLLQFFLTQMTSLSI